MVYCLANIVLVGLRCRTKKQQGVWIEKIKELKFPSVFKKYFDLIQSAGDYSYFYNLIETTGNYQKIWNKLSMIIFLADGGRFHLQLDLSEHCVVYIPKILAEYIIGNDMYLILIK